MVFGAITAATDPVAVVAILKEAGASPNLTMIIVGESLMNDGTAMVLFELFFGMLRGDVLSTGEIALYFLKMVLGRCGGGGEVTSLCRAAHVRCYFVCRDRISTIGLRDGAVGRVRTE